MTIDEFGREVPSEDPIAILGGVIKRMPMIESVGSRELASLSSTTLVSGTGGGSGIGSASVAASSAASSRPPTGITVALFNDAATASLQLSRSNSIHGLRTPSELGELVRDALRAWGQSRSLPSSARPGSGGSVSGSVGGGGASESRSRSNSLGPNEVLPPVTEHGELGRGPDCCQCERDERTSRTERSRSLAGSSSSATTMMYFTAGTSSFVLGSGGDTGTGPLADSGIIIPSRYDNV